MNTENKPEPMAGVADTMTAFNLSDEQWDAMPRAVGYRLRIACRVRLDLLDSLCAIVNHAEGEDPLSGRKVITARRAIAKAKGQ